MASGNNRIIWTSNCLKLLVKPQNKTLNEILENVYPKIQFSKNT